SPSGGRAPVVDTVTSLTQLTVSGTVGTGHILRPGPPLHAEEPMANKPRARKQTSDGAGGGSTSGTNSTSGRRAASAVPHRAAIIGANRIPFGKAGGAYASATNLDMLT